MEWYDILRVILLTVFHNRSCTSIGTLPIVRVRSEVQGLHQKCVRGDDALP